MKNLFSLQDKNIVMTGGTGYLGLAISNSLVECGAKVILIGRSESKFKDLVKGQKLSQDIRFIESDLLDQKSVVSLAAKVREYFQEVHGLINCANLGMSGDITQLSYEDFETTNKLNIYTPVVLSQSLLPLLLKAKGHRAIVNIASMYGKVAPHFEIYEAPEFYNPINYGASKAALIQITKYMACRWAKEGVNVNSVSPGAFPQQTNSNQNLIAQLEKNIPMGRVGDPREVVGAIIFLLSEASSYVTGTDISVDGGWTSR